MLHPSLPHSTAPQMAQAVLTGSHGMHTMDAGGSEGICRVTCARVGVGGCELLMGVDGCTGSGAAPCVQGAQPHLGIAVAAENGR